MRNLVRSRLDHLGEFFSNWVGKDSLVSGDWHRFRGDPVNVLNGNVFDGGDGKWLLWDHLSPLNIIRSGLSPFQMRNGVGRWNDSLGDGKRHRLRRNPLRNLNLIWLRLDPSLVSNRICWLLDPFGLGNWVRRILVGFHPFNFDVGLRNVLHPWLGNRRLRNVLHPRMFKRWLRNELSPSVLKRRRLEHVNVLNSVGRRLNKFNFFV
jgi:hypothetical protein